MKIIGITGGVGSGKSRVLSYLEEMHHAVVCQLDRVACKLQRPGEVCYEKIVAHFGKEVLNGDQTINRVRLGEMVFGNKQELAVLNRMMHPAVKQYVVELIEQEAKKGTSLFVLEAALLLEDNYGAICDELWYIYTDEQIRKSRLKESRGYTEEKIAAILQSQLSEEQFKEGCHKVIDNSGAFAATCAQIDMALDR